MRVEIRGLKKEFRRAGGEVVQAVDGIDLDVVPGEIVVLLGPSGCGKSTLLRCIAGLEEPDEGSIRIDGTTVFAGTENVFLPANERDVNMMFQSYALWPHMTLEDNVAYPLRVEGVAKNEARERAIEFLELVGLHGLGKQFAGAVSGGQQQRVALARTLINEPSAVLFDEPLSNVDARVRALLRAELVRIHQRLQFAAVYVTHDQIEALGLGTRIAVMRAGHVEQLADPVTIYQEPVSRYAAEFIGEANIFQATVVRHEGGVTHMDSEVGAIQLKTERVSRSDGTLPASGAVANLLVRPEYCEVVREVEEVSNESNVWPARIETTMYAGSRTEYMCATGGGTWQAWELASAASPVATGADVLLRVPPDALRVIGWVDWQ